MQQINKSVKNLTDYNQAFNQMIIPKKQPDRLYNTDTISVVDDVNNIESSFIVIDSSCRNWNKDDCDSYTIDLGNSFNYVHSIELIDGFIPATMYNINEFNNIIHFMEDDETLICAEIVCGFYNIHVLIDTITHVMNQSSRIGATYSCKFDELTHHITISSDHVFGLIFSDGTESIGERSMIETLSINPKTNKKEFKTSLVGEERNHYIKSSIGKVLGFKPINLSGQNNYTGQMIYQLHTDKYVAIFVNDEKLDDFKKISAPCSNNGVDGAFALVSLSDNTLQYHRVVDNVRYIKKFNPPIKFTKLKVQIKTMDGYPYKSEGVDHYLIFEIRKLFGQEIITSVRNLS